MNLEAETIETIESTVTANVDPTTDPVAWSFPLRNARPTLWTAGTWKAAPATPAAAGKFRAVAVSPTIGATGAAVVLAAGKTYDAYLKITDNPDTPVRNCGTVYLKG